MATPDLSYAIGLPPAEAIAYFEAKGYAIGWKWQDVWQEAQARAFTAAGVTKVDVLADLRGGLTDALKTGNTKRDYMIATEDLLKKKGWWGKDAQTDKSTGEMHGKGLTPRRLETIFDTNMQSAYSAGRYKTQLANVANRPYWMYVAVMDRRTRPAHAALNGRTFRYDDPIWSVAYPPNGFRCRCAVRALDAEDVASRNIDLSSSEGRLKDIEVPTSRKAGAPTATVTRFEYAPGKYFAPDVGFNYNTGRVAYQPELDKYPRPVAQQYVKGVLTGPAFKQWYQGIVQAVAVGNLAGKSADSLRRELAVGQRYPVAVLSAEYRALLGAKTQTVWLSDETLVKQIVSRDGQAIGLDTYWHVQETIEAAQLIIRQGDFNLVFIRRNGHIYHAVVKATQSGQALFLTSFRQSSLKAAEQAIKHGQVLRNELLGK